MMVIGLRSVIRDYQNRTNVKRESDLLVTSVITDRFRRHEVLFPINQNMTKLDIGDTFS